MTLLSDIRTVSVFEVLCELAQRWWYWNLMCSTCGQGVFRWALRPLTKGFDPGTCRLLERVFFCSGSCYL